MKSGRPLRQCVVCRSRREQRTLLRVVRGGDGQVHVDRERHRAAGRGAYVCPQEACIRRAPQALRRLRGEIAADLLDELRRAAEAARHAPMRA